MLEPKRTLVQSQRKDALSRVVVLPEPGVECPLCAGLRRAADARGLLAAEGGCGLVAACIYR